MYWWRAWNTKNSKLAKIELKEVDYEIIKKRSRFFKWKWGRLLHKFKSFRGYVFAIMEAMSFGIPIICSNIPGNTEIINKLNGYIIKSNTDIEFQNVINQIKVDFVFKNR